MRAWPRESAALLLLAYLGAACASFAPARPEQLAPLALASAPAPAAERRQAWVELESSHVAGRFRALVVIAREPELCLRLQVLPDVGGKLCDLVLSPELVRGYFPHAAVELDHRRDGHTSPPRGLLSFLAASLAESATPITPERVLGLRHEGEEVVLLLAPALEGLRVEARYDAGGCLVERRYRLRHVSWRERFQPEHVFAGRDFRWRLEEETSEAIATPPAALFELRLPQGGGA